MKTRLWIPRLHGGALYPSERWILAGEAKALFARLHAPVVPVRPRVRERIRAVWQRILRCF